MTKKDNTFTLNEFYKSIEEKDVKELCDMIRGGALYSIEEKDSVEVLTKLFSLKDMNLTSEISRHINYIPLSVLSELNPANPKNKEYLNDLLSKYISKFNYKDNHIAGELFELACKSECVGAIRFLLKKGAGESDYPRLASSSPKVFSLISEIKIKALDKDTISTFFMEAALSSYPEDRIISLMEKGFDIRVINSEGLNVCEAFRKGIDNYNYPDDKKGASEKKRDEESYLTLKQIYDDIA